MIEVYGRAKDLDLLRPGTIIAACYIKGRVGYTAELLADMHQTELCGMISGS